MRSVLVALCALTLVNCSDNDSSAPADTNSNMRGSFNVETPNVSKTLADSCTDAKPQLDARLKNGQVFTSINIDKELNDAKAEVSSDDIELLEVNIPESYIRVRNVIKGHQGHSGWILGKRVYSFGQGFAGWNFEIEQVSPNLQAAWQQSQQNDGKNEKWHSCIVDYSTSGLEQTREDGSFTLANGKTVKAQRETETQKGEVECMEMQSVEGQAPKELSRTKMGPGSSTRTRIKTLDLPSLSAYECSGTLTELYRKDEVKLDDGRVLTINGEELTGFR